MLRLNYFATVLTLAAVTSTGSAQVPASTIFGSTQANRLGLKVGSAVTVKLSLGVVSDRFRFLQGSRVFDRTEELDLKKPQVSLNVLSAKPETLVNLNGRKFNLVFLEAKARLPVTDIQSFAGTTRIYLGKDFSIFMEVSSPRGYPTLEDFRAAAGDIFEIKE